MLQQANIPNDLRKTLMPEAVTTVTHLDGLIPQDIDGEVTTRFEHQFGENTPFDKSLRIWEEAGAVTPSSPEHFSRKIRFAESLAY
jgi:hypothetical protein